MVEQSAACSTTSTPRWRRSRSRRRDTRPRRTPRSASTSRSGSSSSRLLVGGDVRIVDAETAADPRALLAVLEHDRVTLAEVVPPSSASCSRRPRARGASTLRWLVVTGEALPPDLCRLWLARAPRHPAAQRLRPHRVLRRRHPRRHRRAARRRRDADADRPAGRQHAHVHRRPGRRAGARRRAPASSDRRRRRRPRLPGPTRPRPPLAFVPDPFSPTPGARRYRSGDLVRRLPERRRIEFLGRLDHQVKVRGFRIELGEVEEALRGHPAVHDAVVVCQVHAGENRLVAYVATAERRRRAPSAPTSRPCCSSTWCRPPSSACPGCRSRPTARSTATRLPAVDAAALAEARPFTAPRTPLEQTIAQIWQDVLELPRVGIDDDFFELGGHSLLATCIAARLRAALRVDFPLRKLFELPTGAAWRAGSSSCRSTRRIRRISIRCSPPRGGDDRRRGRRGPRAAAEEEDGSLNHRHGRL